MSRSGVTSGSASHPANAAPSSRALRIVCIPRYARRAGRADAPPWRGRPPRRRAHRADRAPRRRSTARPRADRRQDRPAAGSPRRSARRQVRAARAGAVSGDEPARRLSGEESRRSHSRRGVSSRAGPTDGNCNRASRPSAPRSYAPSAYSNTKRLPTAASYTSSTTDSRLRLAFGRRTLDVPELADRLRRRLALHRARVCRCRRPHADEPAWSGHYHVRFDNGTKRDDLTDEDIEAKGGWW